MKLYITAGWDTVAEQGHTGGECKSITDIYTEYAGKIPSLTGCPTCPDSEAYREDKVETLRALNHAVTRIPIGL